jgi:hypothetical protein
LEEESGGESGSPVVEKADIERRRNSMSAAEEV